MGEVDYVITGKTHDIIANDDHVVLLANAHATRKGKTLDYSNASVSRRTTAALGCSAMSLSQGILCSRGRRPGSGGPSGYDGMQGPCVPFRLARP